MIIDIDNKLLNNMLVDTFNILGEDVTLSFEEKTVVNRGIDLSIFKNIDNIKLNETIVKTNLSNLTDILKDNNEKSLSVNLEGQNPVALKVFEVVLNDINELNVINIETTEEMNQNNIEENLAFLSSKTKNDRLQKEEQESFINAVETMVKNLKSVLLTKEEMVVSYDQNEIGFSLKEGVSKGLSVLNILPSFLSNGYDISALDVINCYSNCHCNCHSNCYSNCHGSRGWR